MAVSKVVLNGTVLVDLTTDTVTEETLLPGIVATGNDGQKVNGDMASATAVISGTNIVTPDVSVSSTNVSLSTSINNGIYITSVAEASASASVSATTGNAGYAASSTVLGTGTVNSTLETASETQYVSGVTIPKPASGTNSFSVTVPNGNSTVTFTFVVDSSGNVTIE